MGLGSLDPFQPRRPARNLAEYQEAQRQGAQSKLERLEVITALVQEHSTKLQRVVDLYIDGSIDKETWLDRKLRLEDAIAGLRAEQNTIRVEVDAQLIGDDTIAALQAFTANIAEGLDMAETSFIHKRAIIEQLGVTGKIAVENGEKVLHLHCYVDEATFSLKTNSIIDAGSHGTSSCCTVARTRDPAV